MRTVMSDALRRERQQLRLVCCCEDCEHFVDAAAACDLLYPTAPHRKAVWDAAADGEPMSFCKMFEVRTGRP